jgi:hypothetical protein
MAWVLGVLLGWIGLLLTYRGVRRSRSSEARLWALALLALALWTWSEGLIIGASDPELRILGFQVQALGVAGSLLSSSWAPSDIPASARGPGIGSASCSSRS